MNKWVDYLAQLNHIFGSRDLMVKNERKLAKNQESLEGKSVDDDAYLDRGFTRPKVYSSAFMPYNYGMEISCSMLVTLCCMMFSLIPA